MIQRTIDFVEDLYSETFLENTQGYDREKARKAALIKVMPVIIDKELTERQKICFKYKYIFKKTQGEIAELLNLSQPTVSRHINTAKAVINNKLQYCIFAVIAALDSYDSN